uniref:SCP domain-containing protein n=1 Tax=Parastrongyloides trichosuri TaxID=131310 RepID=A0A0N5A7H0_PARTI
MNSHFDSEFKKNVQKTNITSTKLTGLTRYLYFDKDYLYMGDLQTKSFAECIVYSWYKQRYSYNFKHPELNYYNRNFAGIVYQDADKFGCGQLNLTYGIFLGCKIHMKSHFDKDFKNNVQKTNITSTKLTNVDFKCSKI